MQRVPPADVAHADLPSVLIVWKNSDDNAKKNPDPFTVFSSQHTRLLSWTARINYYLSPGSFRQIVSHHCSCTSNFFPSTPPYVMLSKVSIPVGNPSRKIDLGAGQTTTTQTVAVRPCQTNEGNLVFNIFFQQECRPPHLSSCSTRSVCRPCSSCLTIYVYLLSAHLCIYGICGCLCTRVSLSPPPHLPLTNALSLDLSGDADPIYPWRQNQVWDGRTNIVTVEPAQPALPQSAETVMILSRLLILALGVLWILMLLVIGRTLGVDASSVPISDATRDAPSTFGGASRSARGDGESSGVVGGGSTSPTNRMALLEQALGWHQREEFENAAEGYSRLLEVSQCQALHIFFCFCFSFRRGLSPRSLLVHDG